MVPPDIGRCAALAQEAARLEAHARELDNGGFGMEAIGPYREAALRLLEAGAVCPHWHRDKPVLQDHLAELEERIAYLASLHGSPPLLPCERHLAPKQLTMSEDQGTAGIRTLGAVSFFGAAAGLLLMGPRAALFLGAGGAVATTRDDTVGLLTRQVGRVGADVLEWAVELARAHVGRLEDVDWRHDVLYRMGEVVFQARILLWKALAWRPSATMLAPLQEPLE
eukprot:CAMPEP_0172715222 /NCGR_PEP_ID=MMETSP1074-20121228/67424_1 /TAXON_ID=2916 /ORGANISM="Ceratium fusus, Strain PA161109" /LENGTH=223 /DNA_ID=CAMNT_0013539785 /DNA_START=50 /DNA_END=721 /DNA_ORIENTATION=+